MIYRREICNQPGKIEEGFLEEVILKLIASRGVSVCKVKKGRGYTGEEKEKLIQASVNSG